jgi:hypothetical protein
MMDRNTRLARIAGHILEARDDVDPAEDALLCRLIDMTLMELGKQLAASLAVEQRGSLPDLVVPARGPSQQRPKVRRRRAR